MGCCPSPVPLLQMQMVCGLSCESMASCRIPDTAFLFAVMQQWTEVLAGILNPSFAWVASLH